MSRDCPEFVEIVTTTETEEEARRIAAALVERRLAACVQISSSLTSVYRWRGVVESASEYQLTAKCRAASFDAVASAIRELHSYDLPQIIALPIVAASDDYAKWMREETE